MMMATFLKKNLPDRFTLLSYALWINQHYWVIAAMIFVIIGGILAFPASYFTNLNVLLGVCLLPFTIRIAGKQRFNYWFLALLLFSCTAVFYSPVNIFYFFAIASFLLLLVELHIGRINAIILFLIVFMSPFFEQVAGILGFPVRLFLSEMAGELLALSGVNVQVEGNLMLVNGSGFTVDDACMGLNMLSTSMLIGVLLMIHRYKTHQRTLSFVALASFFVTVFGLNVVCNLSRIIVLVLFNIGPGHFMHEGVGLICFIAYSILPVYFLMRWMVQRFGKDVSTDDRSYRRTSLLARCMVMLSAVVMLWIGMELPGRKIISERFTSEVNELPGFASEVLTTGVVKMSNDEALIYLKPITEFFSGEHTPLFCWKGSGYQINHIREVQIGSHVIYCGELMKSDGKLLTAWWYSNGDVQTIDQFDWRGRMLQGEKDFALINVTAADERTMLKYSQKLLEESFCPISKTR